MPANTSVVPLSIIIAVVGGKESLVRCLGALYRQAEEVGAELIVPFDRWTAGSLELASEFPNVRFVEVVSADSLTAKSSESFRHCHYDLRRAVGLLNARGAVIAMTEDHAVPAPDWCRQLLAAHSEIPDTGVIGGGIENGVDRTLNWVWYYCDFGRYGRPFEHQSVEYVSDVNVSYKREAIMAVKDLWKTAFHETTVHWALRRSGVRIVLDPRFVVYQNRPSLPLGATLRERVEWGRAFAATRIGEIGKLKRCLFAIGCLLLPIVLYCRATRHMARHGRPLAFILKISPFLFLLLLFWSIGEVIGYLNFFIGSERSSIRSLDTSISGSL